MALRNIGADFEHHRVVEFDRFAMASYNAIHGTDFEATDVTKITGEDLGIIDTDKYTYLLTYSFPCQDLSLAGAGGGMARDGNTRSGLLWEVERLLKETENKPQILLMENVPQVLSEKHIDDFREWERFLENLGYSNYIKVLNAKDFEIPQNRERAFMVSIMGDYSYNFPKELGLSLTIKDLLEDEVDERYYINNDRANKLIQLLLDRGDLSDGDTVDSSINNPKKRDVANAVTAGDRGIVNHQSVGNAVIKQVGNITPNPKRKNPQTSRVYDVNGLSPTLNTMQGGNLQPMIVASRGRNPNNPSDRTAGSPTEQRLEPNKDGCSNTITTVQKDNLVLEPKMKFVGSISDKDIAGDGKSLSRNAPQGERVYDSDGVGCTITANGGGTGGPTGLYLTREQEMVKQQEVIGSLYHGASDRFFRGLNKEVHRTLKANINDNPVLLKESQEPIRVKQATEKGYIECEPGGVADLSYPTSKLRRGRVQDGGNISPTLTCSDGAIHRLESKYRIRKLTPKETWRLMNFSDEDFHKAEKVNSNSQLYRQAGNSIVVKVLEEIFKQLNITSASKNN